MRKFWQTALLMVAGLLALVLSPPVIGQARELPDTGLTAASAIIKDSSGNTISHTATLYQDQVYSVHYTWRLPSYITIRAGDTMTVTLPDNVILTEDIDIPTTNTAAGGRPIGRFVMKAGSRTGQFILNDVLGTTTSIRRVGYLNLDVLGATPVTGEAPEEPGTEEPGTEEPGTTVPPTPENPGVTEPETPGVTEPENPGTEEEPGSETPGTTEPETPGTETPGTTEPETPGTETPSVTEPEAPGTTTPGTTEPENPENGGSGSTAVPEEPGTTAPSVPEPGDDTSGGGGVETPTQPGTGGVTPNPETPTQGGSGDTTPTQPVTGGSTGSTSTPAETGGAAQSPVTGGVAAEPTTGGAADTTANGTGGTAPAHSTTGTQPQYSAAGHHVTASRLPQTGEHTSPLLVVLGALVLLALGITAGIKRIKD